MYEVETMTLSKNMHLTKEDIIKNGSVFTPDHIVDIAKTWLENEINENDTIIDFGVGYGAFISKFTSLSNNCIATDVDEKSISFINEYFPNINAFHENSLINISRKKYNLNSNNRVFIIGNPPYNDVTSQYKKGKKGNFNMDEKVYSRDLGVSFMKMYALLEPECICILHPLSYLIKKTNFSSLKFFKDNYLLKKGLIFSSKEFESINKSNAEFPVCLALYKRIPNVNMDFNYIRNFVFSILDNNKTFSLRDYKTIDGWVNKYPKKNSKKPTDLQFYTIRDINALKRNKSFLVGKVANGVKVEIESLYKYAWLDYFKNNFTSDNMFIYGNLSPLYSEAIEKDSSKKSLISYIYNNNNIVKDFIDNNNLEMSVKKFYDMDSFNYCDSYLKEILESFSDL